MSLSAIQFRLVKLCEEASEVQKRACKQMQFGTDQHDEGYAPNRVRLRDEILDFMVVVRLLQHYGVIDPVSQYDVVQQFMDKRDKIIKMSELAVSTGEVSAELLDQIPTTLL